MTCSFPASAPMPLGRIGGISSDICRSLRTCRITNTSQLLEATRSPEAKNLLIERTGIDPRQLERFLARTKIRQIQGIGIVYSMMLEMLGLAAPERLAAADATALCRQLASLNARETLARRTPREGEIRKWVEAAKSLLANPEH